MTKPNKTKDDLRDDAENQPTPNDKIKEYNESRATHLMLKSYSNDGTVLVKGGVNLGSLGDADLSSWSQADFYKDNQGYSAVITHDSDGGAPLEVRIQIPDGNDKTLFIINTQTIMHHDNANIREADRIVRKLEQKIKAGASLKEISSDFKSYQRSEYPEEIAMTVANQKAINKDVINKVKTMNATGSYKMCIAEPRSTEFDNYMQQTAIGPVRINVAQDTKDLSGDITADVKNDYHLALQYNEQSTDVQEVRIEHLNFERGKVNFTKYTELLNLDTLMQYGYDKENAQRKLNKIAEQLYAGKNLDQLFFDNKQFMTEKSSELLKEDMAKKTQQQRPSFTKLRKISMENYD